MKKLLIVLLLSVPLAVHAGGGKFGPKIRRVVQQALDESPGVWNSIERALEQSIRFNTKSAEEMAAQIAKLNTEFSARKLALEDGFADRQIMTLLKKAQASHLQTLSPEIPAHDFWYLLIADAYGPNKLTTPPDYRQEGRPTVTTKQDFYVWDYNGDAVTKVYIPTGSTVQLDGKLTPQTSQPYEVEWLSRVAFELKQSQRFGTENLRRKASQPLLKGDATFTWEELGQAVASIYGADIVSPSFLVHCGALVEPAVVTRIPLHITMHNGSTVVHPAGTLFSVSREPSGEYSLSKLISNTYYYGLNHDFGEHFPAVLEKLFTKEVVNGQTVYHPKMFMLWEEGYESYIIGPKDSLLLFKEDGELRTNFLTKPMTLEEFQAGVQKELPSDKELLGILPEPKTGFHTFRADEVDLVGQETDVTATRYRYNEDEVNMIFGPDSFIARKYRNGNLTRADLQKWSDQLSQRPQERNAAKKAKVDVQPEQPVSQPKRDNTVRVQKVEPQQAEKPVVMNKEDEIGKLMVQYQIDPKPKKLKFKYFNPRHHKGPNVYEMYEVLEDNVQLSSGKVANRGDYLDVTSSTIVVRKKEDVESGFIPVGK